MRKTVRKIIVLPCVFFLLLPCVVPMLTVSNRPDEICVEESTVEVSETEAVEEMRCNTEETALRMLSRVEVVSSEETEPETDAVVEDTYETVCTEPAVEPVTECPESVLPYGLTESDVDIIANVVMHEVGDLYGEGSHVVITYANGETAEYDGSCIIHEIHTQVLLNQYNSPLFPDTVAQCVRMYWAGYLASTGYYSSANETWQHCREDVVSVLNSGFTIPDNVFGATCDPYFASKYTFCSLYATVRWSTRWCSGTFYYYQRND